MIKFLLTAFHLIFLILLLNSCFDNNGYNTDENSVSEEVGYKDGTYCAEVDYYYSNTGTSSTYTLEIEIEDNNLIKIYWPNGGWLDDSHFSPPDISNGKATFESDKGVEYTVRVITGSCYPDNYVDDIDAIEQEQNYQNNYEYENDILEEDEF